MGRAKPRFPDYSRAVPALKVSAADWERIEEAYRHKLTNVMRERIIEASEILKFNAIFADNNRVADVEKRIKRIQKSATALHSAFRDGQRGPVQSYSDILVDSCFSTEPLSSTLSSKVSSLNILIKQIESLDTACTRALVSLETMAKNTPLKQTIWGLWVDSLTSTLSANQLPVSARKDSDKSSRRSGFVAFVRELQKSVPEEYRPSFQSNEALAQAINRARR
jgi:hypothetical protein